MAFDIEKLLKGFLGDRESSTKKNNNTNAKKRIDDGGKAKLRADQAKSNAKKMKDSKGQGRSTKAGDLIGLTRVRTGPKRSTLVLTEDSRKVSPSKDNLKDRMAALATKKKNIALRAKKEKEGIDKAYSRNTDTNTIQRLSNDKKALSIIKKDTSNTKTDDTSKKRRVITKAELKKSGLSLRDYMNKLDGKTRIKDKNKPKMYNSIYSDKKITAAQRLKEISKEKLIAAQKKAKSKKTPSKMNPNKANEFASLKKMTNTVKKNKDGKMVIKKNKQGKYVIKKGY